MALGCPDSAKCRALLPGEGVSSQRGESLFHEPSPPPPLLQDCGSKSMRDKFNEGESSAEIHWKGWGVGSISL